LCNAPSTFQRLMNTVLRDFIKQFCWLYVDDILIYSTTREQLIKHLKLIHQKLTTYNLHPCVAKSIFLQTEVSFCGYVVDENGTYPENGKLRAVESWPVPTTVTEIRSFIGLTGFYQHFIEGFQRIALPLTNLFRKDVPWSWTPACQQAFVDLKAALLRATGLGHIDPKQSYHLYTDASKDCIGATLAQRVTVGIHKGHLRPVAFMSRKMNAAECRYPVREQELLAIHAALKHWQHWIGQISLALDTDHESLQYL